MSRLTRDGTAEPVSRDQIFRHARGQGSINFPCSADHEQDWQPYPVDPYSAICDDHTYIHIHTHTSRVLDRALDKYVVLNVQNTHHTSLQAAFSQASMLNANNVSVSPRTLCLHDE